MSCSDIISPYVESHVFENRVEIKRVLGVSEQSVYITSDPLEYNNKLPCVCVCVWWWSGMGGGGGERRVDTLGMLSVALLVSTILTKHIYYGRLFAILSTSVPRHTSVSSLVEGGYTWYDVTGVNSSVLEN